MSNPDPLTEVISASHIDDVLRRAGVLNEAHVRAVAVEPVATTVLSRIQRLHIGYDRAVPDAPQTLVLKTVHPERAQSFWFAGRQEVAFYNDVAPVVGGRGLLRCFEAKYDEDSRIWHLLLQDVAQTHRIATAWPVPPTTAQCEQIVTALARFHAALWDHPRLGNGIGRWRGQAETDAQRTAAAAELGLVADRLGDTFPVERRVLFERLLSSMPRLMQRYHSHRHATVLHGDAHAWNYFLPIDSGPGEALPFDWDSWRVEPGARDLAYLMAMHWYPDRRRRLEGHLLDVYHRVLLESGVAGYDRAALAEDYRWSVLLHMITPLWQAVHNIPAGIWWNNHERLMMAVDDLGCRELLD